MQRDQNLDKINVVVLPGDFSLPIGKDYLAQIASVSPRIRLEDVSNLVEGERKGDPGSKAAVAERLAEAEIVYGLRPPDGFLSRAPRLKWFQTMLSGVDRFLDAEFKSSPVIVTNWPHGEPVAEFAIYLMISLAKKATVSYRNQLEKTWYRFTPTLLESKTVGILGLGSAGHAIARIAKGFNMRVVATRRSAKKAGRAHYVDLLLPPSRLNELLTESDFVVVALPYTPETRNLIGEAQLSAMKLTAYLINVSRGEIVDENALISALNGSKIAGAALDSFTTEPLPPGSPLWGMPNVIITPHLGGVFEEYTRQATELFCENLRRYIAGDRLLNVVDKKKGY